MSFYPVHRSFSEERGTGTFHSLGVLPKRTHDACPRKSPVFHIAHDDDDEHSSSLDELSSSPLDEHSPLPTPSPADSFPCSGSSSPSPSASTSSSTPRPSSPCPQLSRGASSPILLSNGKPLKSSLKSSSSSPAVLIPTNMHFRARSEPSTPKNVHFPEKDYALATVRVFNCTARPAALSNPANTNGDETETEGEDAPPSSFPFPSFPPGLNYEIDPTRSSPVPSESSSPANLFIESLNLSSSSFSSTSSATKPLLTGSILVRNLAFEKHVAIRFTLDDWQTVSEVGVHYVDSLPLLPSQILPSPPLGDSRGRGWDRFTFTIRLEDYAPSLSTRTLWFAARYRIDSTYPEPGSSQYGPGGEWWDNNGGKNYRVEFRPATTSPTPPRSKPRRETISAPISPPRTQPQPPMTCKGHALGLIIPSVPNKEERRSPMRTGKLNLCNYASPIVRAASSISFPSAGSPQTPSPSSITNAALSPSATLRSSSDEDTASPASSTLSTPSVSPTIVPRVIIGGQPATPICGSSEGCGEDAIAYSRPGYIADWDWSASSRLRIEAPSRQHVDLVLGSEPSERQRDIPSLLGTVGRKVLPDSNSLYDAFVTQWCFARGPSPSHHAYDGGGIMI